MELAEAGVSSASASDDRRGCRGHRHRRGPRAVQGGDDRDRPPCRRQARPARRPSCAGLRRPSGSTPPWPWPARWSSASACPSSIRPAYILGGKGTGIASTPEEFEKVASFGLDASPITEILIEKSIAGWKEYELEVMRDRADNCVIICSIENVDPMGVHTGDSITVAPAQTLSDVEYQKMQTLCSPACGASGSRRPVERAVRARSHERRHGRHRDEPVSRSSALASKATGFPIARSGARRGLHARRDPERHHPQDARQLRAHDRLRGHQGAAVGVREVLGQRPVLGTQMQSVGEAMAIGRTFPESLQALRSLEQDASGSTATRPRSSTTT
ncbi:MAG: hypothetical protein R2711_04405 [Acidimicrobiales bacterium]